MSTRLAIRTLRFSILFVTVLMLTNCRAQEAAVVPTLAVLPSMTFTSLPTVTSSFTHTVTLTLIPSDTFTPDLVATQRTEIEMTNAAGQLTLEALWTSMAPTFTPTHTYTASLTITMTRTPLPSLTPLPTATPTARLRVLSPSTYYARSTANIRSCPSRSCDPIGQLVYGSPITVTGSIEGDEVNAGNNLWYQVSYSNESGYIYSNLVAQNLPTAVPPVSTQPPIVYSSPVYSPPSVSGGSCPRTCGEMASCEQAYICLRTNSRLDRDGDGVPCESICPGG